MNVPSEQAHALIEALREELQEYGTLLGLLKHQQTVLLRRQPEEVLVSSGSIEAHLPVVGRARRQRQEEVRFLAGGATGSPDDASIRLSDLLPHFPGSIVPMIRALVEEINRLVSQVGRFARQNQMLLARAVDSTQAVLQSVQPGIAQKTYSPRGRMVLNVADEYAGSTWCVA